MKSVKAVAALLMTGVMLLTSGCFQNILGGISGKGKEYDSIIDKWKEGNTFEDEASKDAIGVIFAASEAKDHDEFKECFTEEIRTKVGFDGRIDEFMDAFPKGLSEAELTYIGGGAGGSVDYDSFVSGAAYNYTCTLNGEWYFVSLSFCFRNDKHPEEIGVEQFLVMNLNARAYHIEKESRDINHLDHFDILCDIKSEAEAPARLIDGTPLLWTETDAPKLSEDQMRDLLGEYGTLGKREVRDKLGDSNAVFKPSTSAAYIHYYELQPVNGEPRYAKITCKTNYGTIYDAYVCSPDDTIYDNSLYERG